MKIIALITFISLVLPPLSNAQKPSLKESYKFKSVPKISLKELRIPTTAGQQNIIIDYSEKGEKNKKRGPSSNDGVVKGVNKLSVSGACTSQDGGIIASHDPRYENCLDGSVYVKKVILTDPTQSILMNYRLDGINFNPFD